MIEVKVKGHRDVLAIRYKNGDYSIDYVDKALNEKYPYCRKEEMLEMGWDKEVLIIERKLKLKKLLRK